METSPQKILIIDDDERNIFALSAVLRAKGYQCSTASGGTHALEMLQKDKEINIALVDMMMPDIDGYELMMLIKKIPSLKHVKLIAVTAQAMPGDKDKCLNAGADNYISKPVDLDLLLEMIQQISANQ
ncbi:MAG: response regulator [Chitinophagaceae bacterium]|nr:MAG: response regulator [Chitinophagaceae bacterium]